MIKLSSRLTAIAELVPNDAKLIDVGCDHAFLDIYLVEHHKGLKHVASDNKQGPLEKARINLEQYGMVDEVILQLSEGLTKVDEDIDTAIIAGMGGRNIIGILKQGNLNHINTLILSPNNDVSLVREYICKNYYFENEDLVEDGKYIYPIMLLKKGKRYCSKKELYFGPVLISDQNKLFYEYYGRSIRQKELLLKLLPKNYIYKKYLVKKELKLLKSVVK